MALGGVPLDFQDKLLTHINQTTTLKFEEQKPDTLHKKKKHLTEGGEKFSVNSHKKLGVFFLSLLKPQIFVSVQPNNWQKNMASKLTFTVFSFLRSTTHWYPTSCPTNEGSWCTLSPSNSSQQKPQANLCKMAPNTSYNRDCFFLFSSYRADFF